jgi:hypothetical protein
MDKNASPNDPRKLGQVEIVTAHSPADSALIADLFDKVWDVKAMVSPEIMTASLHNGGYGSVVYIGMGKERIAVGAAFALVRAAARTAGQRQHGGGLTVP